MRLILDMVSLADHQIQGQVIGDNLDNAIAFSGWLDFVRVLENLLAPAVPRDVDKAGSTKPGDRNAWGLPAAPAGQP